MDNIKIIKRIDTSSLFESLKQRLQLFNQVRLRQTYEGSAHTDSKTIFIRGPEQPSLERWFMDVPHTTYQTWPELSAVVEQAADGRELGKIMLVMLKAGGKVGWHTDLGKYAPKYNRLHVALQTNQNCRLYSGVEYAYLPAGWMAEFNNHIPHSAVNFGDTDRIHLIADYRNEI